MEGCHKPFPSPVEADETAVGGLRKNMHKAKREALKGRGTAGKAIVAGVKDRDSKQVSAAVVEQTDAKILQTFVTDWTEETATVYSDDATAYHGIKRDHGTVRHSVGEYVNGEAHTNGIEIFGACSSAVITAFSTICQTSTQTVTCKSSRAGTISVTWIRLTRCASWRGDSVANGSSMKTSSPNRQAY